MPEPPGIPKPARGLPCWLVKSTELSLIQELTRRYNTERVYALVAERKTTSICQFSIATPL